MKQFKKLLGWINSPYKDFLLRLGVAVFSGHLIVSHGYGFVNVVYERGYGISVIASILIALILLVLVNMVTVQLDRYLPWHRKFKVRAIGQLALGGLVAVAVAYGLAAYLFIYMGRKIEESDYMKYDFYFICIYIAVVNSYYYVRARFQRKRLLKDELDHYKKYHRNYAIRQAPPNLKDIDLTALGIEPNTIACVCRIGGVIHLYKMDGSYEVVTKKEEHILSSLPKEDYITLNRYFLAHRLLIYSVTDASSRRVAVVLRAPFNEKIPNDHKYVSQGLTESFLAAYNA